MIRAEWVRDMRAEIDKRIKQYEGLPPALKANGFARLALADSIAELAAENAHELRFGEGGIEK